MRRDRYLFQSPPIIQTYLSANPVRNVQIYYPVVTGLMNEIVQYTINQTIMKKIGQLLEERDLYEPSLVELQSWFEVKTNQRGVLSIALYAYSFTGGAHGMTTIRSLTFDVSTGKQVTLNDLFISNAKYEDVILRKIKEQVETRDIPVIQEPIVFPSQNNFYIADKSLVLYYQLYDLAPYVYGISYFPISIYDIQSIVADDSVLGKMFGSF